MSSILKTILVVLLAAFAVLAMTAAFTVHQTQHALVTRFGQPIRAISEPGLYFKVPFVDAVATIDKRVLDMDRSSPLEVIANDQKRIVVDSIMRFKITNPLQFFQTVNNIAGAQARLSSILDSSLRGKLAEASFEAIVRDRRSELQESIRKDADREAKGFGIDVIDVRIRRADLPEANSEAVFNRMRTERVREATLIRANGQAKALETRARAERRVAELIGEANKKSEEIRGKADADKNRIFADAFNRDPDFFAFYRSMQAYEAGLRAGDTRLILSPDSDFFRYFSDPFGRRNPAPAEAPK